MTRIVLVELFLAVLLYESTGPVAADAQSPPLAVSVTADPLRIGLMLSGGHATAGNSVQARGYVTNLGAARLTDVVLTIRVPIGISVAGSADHDLGPVAGGASASTSWSLCASSAGNYLVLVTGAAADSAGRTWTATSNATLLTVSLATRKCR